MTARVSGGAGRFSRPSHPPAAAGHTGSRRVADGSRRGDDVTADRPVDTVTPSRHRRSVFGQTNQKQWQRQGPLEWLRGRLIPSGWL